MFRESYTISRPTAGVGLVERFLAHPPLCFSSRYPSGRLLINSFPPCLLLAYPLLHLPLNGQLELVIVPPLACNLFAHTRSNHRVGCAP